MSNVHGYPFQFLGDVYHKNDLCGAIRAIFGDIGGVNEGGGGTVRWFSCRTEFETAGREACRGFPLVITINIPAIISTTLVIVIHFKFQLNLSS